MRTAVLAIYLQWNQCHNGLQLIEIFEIQDLDESTVNHTYIEAEKTMVVMSGCWISEHMGHWSNHVTKMWHSWMLCSHSLLVWGGKQYGGTLSDPAEIQEIAVKFFCWSLHLRVHWTAGCAKCIFDDLPKISKKSLREQHYPWRNWLAPFRAWSVWSHLALMDSLKSFFYRFFWTIIGKDLLPVYNE